MTTAKTFIDMVTDGTGLLDSENILEAKHLQDVAKNLAGQEIETRTSLAAGAKEIPGITQLNTPIDKVDGVPVGYEAALPPTHRQP